MKSTLSFCLFISIVFLYSISISAQYEDAIEDVTTETIGTIPRTTEILRGGARKNSHRHVEGFSCFCKIFR
jgi:hypothetical protein